MSRTHIHPDPARRRSVALDGGLARLLTAEKLNPGDVVSLAPPHRPESEPRYEVIASSPFFVVMQPLAPRHDGSPAAPVSVNCDRDFYRSDRPAGN